MPRGSAPRADLEIGSTSGSLQNLTREFREECEAASEAAQAVVGGALQAERAQLLQNYSLFGSEGEEKVPPACLAHWPGAVLLIWGKCLIPGTTAGSLHLVIAERIKTGGNANCSLPDSTGCSAVYLCMESFPR